MLLTLAFAVAAPAPAVDYQKVADATEWKWSEQGGTVGHSVLTCESAYDVRLEVKATKRREVKVTFSKDGKDAFTLNGHRNTVFRVAGDTLVYARFHPSATGAAMVAVDLRTGKQLWKTDLKGIGPVSHFAYSNYLNLEADGDTVTVFGNEASGKYVEILDAKTGKTVGHKKFPEDKPEQKQ